MRLKLIFVLLSFLMTTVVKAKTFKDISPPSLQLVLQYSAGMPSEFYNIGMCFSDSRAILQNMFQQTEIFDSAKLYVIVMLDVAVNGYFWSRHAVVYHTDGWIYDPSIGGPQPQPVTIKPVSVKNYFARVITKGPRLLRLVQGLAYVQNDGMSYLNELYRVDDPNFPSLEAALPGGGRRLSLQQFLEMSKFYKDGAR